jgi:hypothetical protein
VQTNKRLNRCKQARESEAAQCVRFFAKRPPLQSQDIGPQPAGQHMHVLVHVHRNLNYSVFVCLRAVSNIFESNEEF